MLADDASTTESMSLELRVVLVGESVWEEESSWVYNQWVTGTISIYAYIY